MRKLFLAGAAAAAMLLPGVANAQSATVTYISTAAIPGNNDFQADLLGVGLTQYTATGASLVLSGPALITFEFLGSESGFSDTFTVPTAGINYTENTLFVDNWATPVAIGAGMFAGGPLAGLLNFTSSGGMPATVGSDGFGIFLPANFVSGGSLTTFYLGYDDQITQQDDNHDDMIIRATISAPVPEPGTWAMMLLGFGLAGFAIRRQRRSSLLPQIA